VHYIHVWIRVIVESSFLQDADFRFFCISQKSSILGALIYVAVSCKKKISVVNGYFSSFRSQRRVFESSVLKKRFGVLNEGKFVVF